VLGWRHHATIARPTASPGGNFGHRCLTLTAREAKLSPPVTGPDYGYRGAAGATAAVGASYRRSTRGRRRPLNRSGATPTAPALMATRGSDLVQGVGGGRRLTDDDAAAPPV
jgi:hypothetical protein